MALRGWTTHYRKQGFSILELLVVITIIGILSSLVVVNLTKTRSKARDSRRKQDVGVYTGAVTQYQVITGSNNLPAGIRVDPPAPNPAYASSQGRLNYKGIIGTRSTGVVGYISTTTMAQVLVNKGVLNNATHDPANSDLTDVILNQPDYVYVRCHSDGEQQHFDEIGSADSFAVWAKLENSPSSTDISNTSKNCGGTKQNGDHGSSGCLTGSIGCYYIFGYGIDYDSDKTSFFPSPEYGGPDEVALKYYSLGSGKGS